MRYGNPYPGVRLSLHPNYMDATCRAGHKPRTVYPEISLANFDETSENNNRAKYAIIEHSLLWTDN